MRSEVLEQLEDPELLSRVEALVRAERRITVRLLRHLCEVERRRLHLRRAFSSLHDYLVRGLAYSDGAAHRRIMAMRAFRTLPEIESALLEGRVSLTTASQLQDFIRMEERYIGHALPIEKKRALLGAIEGRTSREAEKILLGHASFPPERVLESEKRVSASAVAITFTADDELLAMFERIRQLGGHQLPDGSYFELMRFMARKTLAMLDPEPSPRAASAPKREARDETISRSRYIRAKDRRELREIRAEGCAYVYPETGRRCSSRHALQIEHKIPFAKGGTNTANNLEWLCPNHNRLRAVDHFGAKVMGRYLRIEKPPPK